MIENIKTENQVTSKDNPLNQELLNQQVISSENNDTTYARRKIILLTTVSIFVITLGIALLYTTNKIEKINTSNNTVNPTSNISPAHEPIAIKTKMSSYLRTNNSEIGLPEGWKVNISNNTANSLSARAFLPDEDNTTTFVEIQVVPSTEYIDNQTLEFDSKDIVNGITVQKGKENFLNSTRVVLEVLSENNGAKTSLTFFAPNDEKLNQYHQTLIDMIGCVPNTEQINYINLIPQAFAQSLEDTLQTPPTASIAGMPISEAKPLEIMDGPYPERIISSDTQYQDGYAKLYSFEYIPGQRIEALIEENTEDRTEMGSFIATELWEIDETGSANKLLDMGTRLNLEKLDLNAGTYYIVAHTFENKEGRVLIKIFDLNQVTDLYYAKYADGSEHLINGNSDVSSNQEAVLLVRFTSPIEVVLENTVRWFRKQDNGCIDCKSPLFGDLTVPFTITINNIENSIKIVKIFSNQAIVQPVEGGGFPINSSIRFNLDFGTYNGTGSGYSGG
ncbi:hypothetical protein KKD03_05270, partial [Patescibacteria group bacterium]|nr:hypothetical protein [Patescibacteria group bacterium]